MRKAAMMTVLVALVLAVSLTSYAEKPKLIFDTQDFAPFSYLENNKAAGPGTDIVELVCKNINIDYEIRLLPWTRAQDEVKKGEAHGLFFIGKNKEREVWLEFGPPIINTEYGIFVNKEDKTVHKEIKDFTKYTIGVFGPSNTATSLLEAVIGVPNVKVEMTVDDIAAFKKLEVKRVSAVYSNSDVGKAMIKNLKLEGVRYAFSHRKLQYFIGFSKTKADKALVKKFYDELIKLQKSGDIKKILDKYDME